MRELAVTCRRALAEEAQACESRLDNLIPDRVAHEFANGMDLELPYDVRTVRFSRLHADAQNGCNFLARLSFGKQLDDFAFARSEAVADEIRNLNGATLAVEITQDQLRSARS